MELYNKMTQITASMVKALREKTDAPMMECKKALAESNGNLIKAEELLRVKLGSKANKVSSRVTAEGLIGSYISEDKKIGSIVEINCETDFVAKNTDFIEFVNLVAKLITIRNPLNIEELLAIGIEQNKSLNELRLSLIGKIGENISIRRFNRMQTNDNLINYIHNGRFGSLVNFNGNDIIAKDIAMHIVANKPKSLNIEGISAEEIEFERSIAKQKAKDSNKSPEIIDKIIDGSIQKFLREVTLLNQPFIKDESINVNSYLQKNKTNILNFILYVVGDGIERKNNNFAHEVAATISNNWK